MEALRKLTIAYLEKENSLSQNETARRAGIPTSTFSKFLAEKFAKITCEQESALLAIIKPEYSDVDVIAGRIKQIVLRKYPRLIAESAIIRLAENLQKP